MVKIIEKRYPLIEQENFIEKMQAYRANLRTLKPSEHKSLGKALSKDGVTYLLAILCKCIQENSGYLEQKKERRRAAELLQRNYSNEKGLRTVVAAAAASSSQASTRIGRGLTKNLEFAVSSNGQRPHRNRKNSNNAASVNYDLSD